MIVTIIIILAIGIWAIFAYNRLVRDRMRVATAWSDIDVQLKRRHDLIPKLVEAVQQYAQYEAASLGAITELRGRTHQLQDAAQVGAAERSISADLAKLFALAEAYPDLKANESYLDLQRNLTEVEQYLQHARRYYNGAVRNLNIRIETIPDSLIANAFGFRQAAFFEFENDG